MPKSLITGAFPSSRLRRLRQHDWSRRLTRETKPSPDDIVWGMIVHDGKEPRVPVKTMPGATVSGPLVSRPSKASKSTR